MYTQACTGKPEGKSLLGGPGQRWYDNIKTHLQELGWVDVDWIHMGQDRDRW
jgi:hypothetical protein